MSQDRRSRGERASPAAVNDVLSTEYPVLSTLATVLCQLLICGILCPSLALSQDTSDTATAPALTAAQMLERFGVDSSQQAAFFSGQPLTPSEEDVLVKILYHLPRLGRDNVHRWRQASPRFTELTASPEEHRLQVFRLKGRATRVSRHALLPEQVELYEFRHYYQVALALEGNTHEALVAVRHVPAAWRLDQPLSEPAEADGLFLKAGDPASEQPQLIFAAERVAWFPGRPDPAQGIDSSDVALAKAGFDIGLWDDVRSSKEQALAAADREAFYQLLGALGKGDPSLIRSASSKPVDVAALLASPADHQGAIFPIEGIARRVMRIPVSDADVRMRFGLDHYFEIDLFLPLRGPSLRLGKPKKGEDGPVFQNEFPATLIVRQLPSGLEEGENVHQLVAADAVFFKIWAYRSSYTAKFGQLQPAPLFLAAQPRVVVVQTPNNWLTGALVVVALGLALAVMVTLIWSQSRSARKSKSKADPRPLKIEF